MATPGTIAFSKLGDLLETHFAHFSIGMSNYGLGQLSQALEKSKWIFGSCVRHGDNCFGPMAFCLWARASRGNFPFDELVGCLGVLPGNNLASICVSMAEGYWHIHHGRTEDAVIAFEKAWQISWTNSYLVTYNSWVLSDYAAALRIHAQAVKQHAPEKEAAIRRRWYQIARWANYVSLVLPPERPRALRELALVHLDRGHLKKAWKLAEKSCGLAQATKSGYEYVKSLMVMGQVAKKLGRPEADEQILFAQREITRLEKAVDDLIG
jgi:eukaryotic-like serine/threonine-protein kinase